MIELRLQWFGSGTSKAGKSGGGGGAVSQSSQLRSDAYNQTRQWIEQHNGQIPVNTFPTDVDEATRMAKMRGMFQAIGEKGVMTGEAQSIYRETRTHVLDRDASGQFYTFRRDRDFPAITIDGFTNTEINGLMMYTSQRFVNGITGSPSAQTGSQGKRSWLQRLTGRFKT